MVSSGILPDITVVIPTVGRPTLARCLESLRVGDAWPRQLVLSMQGVLHGANAGALDRCRASGLHVAVLERTDVGSAKALNNGFAHVATPFVAVTHDDCTVSDDWLRQLRRSLGEEPGCIVTGQVFPDPGPRPVPSTFMGDRRLVFRRRQLIADRLFPANMGLPMEVARLIGPFDEDVRLCFAEDNDWSYRAVRKRIPIVFRPEPRVTHLAWRSDAELAQTYRQYAHSQGALYGKYIRRGDGFMAARATLDLGSRGVALLRDVVTRPRRDSTARRDRLVAVAAGLIAGLARRWDVCGAP